MSGKILKEALSAAARDFAAPQIKIVRPSVVIAFGKQTFDALRSVIGLGLSPKLCAAIGPDLSFELHRATVWCLAHPANRNRRAASSR